jgi:fumarate reductase subunit D
MKRSHDPIFWSLFGAGGMLSALIGPALVFVTGIGVPLALLLSPNLMEYERMLALTQQGRSWSALACRYCVPWPLHIACGYWGSDPSLGSALDFP